MTPDCSKIHKYAVSTVEGISEVLHTEEEVVAHFRSKERHEHPEIVAYHQVDINRLVNHPDSIEIYCAVQTHQIEAELQASPTKVDFTKRS